jgi:hypothetical protein
LNYNGVAVEDIDLPHDRFLNVPQSIATTGYTNGLNQ